MMSSDIPAMTEDQFKRGLKEIERQSEFECPENPKDGRTHKTYFVARLDSRTNYHWCIDCKKGYEKRAV
jgi:hypothetical protein